MAGKPVNLSGDMYIAALDSDKKVVSGYFFAGQVYPFNFNLETSSATLPSGRKGQRGQTAHSKIKIDGMNGACTFHELMAKTAAMLVYGSAVKNTLEAGNNTIAAFDIPTDGTWGKLPHTKVSNPTVDSAAIADNYEVNAAVGLIRVAPSKDAATLGGEQPVAYDFAAGSGFDITMGNSSTTRFAVIIDGRDEDDGSDVNAVFDSVVFAPSGGFPVIDDPETDFQNWECSLEFETVPGKDSPGSINGIELADWADA